MDDHWEGTIIGTGTPYRVRMAWIVAKRVSGWKGFLRKRKAVSATDGSARWVALITIRGRVWVAGSVCRRAYRSPPVMPGSCQSLRMRSTGCVVRRSIAASAVPTYTV